MTQGKDVLRSACGGKQSVNPVLGLGTFLCLAASLSAFVVAQHARGEQTVSPEEQARKIVIFKGSVLQEPIRRLTLTLKETLLIKTDIACERVDLRPEGVVRAKVLSPHEVLVTGQAAGSTELSLSTENGKTPAFRITVAAAPGKAKGKAEPFKASVRVAPVQRLTLKLNKSMLVQTNFPCRRVQVLSTALATQKGQTQMVTETERKGDKTRRVTREEPREAEDKHKDIIQAEIITPTEILVLGKWFGMTQLLLFTEDNQVQILEVTVEADVEQLNEVIAKEVPQAKVQAKSVLEAIVLDGEVPDTEVRDRVLEIANVFAKGEGQVRDHMRVRSPATMPGETSAERLAELQLKQLNGTIAELSPMAKVHVKRIMGTFILQGRVPDVETAEKIAEIAEIFAKQDPSGAGEVKNHLQVAGVQQVLLRCTVAEVSKQALRELGVNGWMAGNNVKDMFVVNQVGQINPANIGAAADSLVAPLGSEMASPHVPFLTDQNGIPLQPNVPLSLGFPRVQMQLFINAMRQNSLLRILAEPNLMAISGQEATFLVGGEYAYPVPQEGGVPAVDFKEFGVRLAFTPVVLAGQRIRLRIMPEVSQPDDTIGTVIQGTTVPGKSSRQLETVVEIGNGQTLALAGLLNDRIRGVAQKVPALGDIPVLGALFSSVQYQRNLTELLVLCTPELVAPLNPDQVPPVPGEEITSPNDWQLFALGELQGEKDPPPTEIDRALKTAPPVRGFKQQAAASPAGGAMRLSLHGPWGAAEGGETD